MHWRLGGGVGEWSITDLESITVLSKIFCLIGPKNFVREPFCVSENFWCGKKVMDERGGRGSTFFRRKFFVSQCRKTSWENLSVFPKNWGFKKIYA